MNTEERVSIKLEVKCEGGPDSVEGNPVPAKDLEVRYTYLSGGNFLDCVPDSRLELNEIVDMNCTFDPQGLDSGLYIVEVEVFANV